MKLRGRTEAPDGAEGAQFLSARGAKPQAPHGPLQRLLDVNGTSASHSTQASMLRRSWRVGRPDNLSEWHNQQRGLPQPPTRWPLRKRPAWSSQTQATALPCVRR